MEHKVAQLLQLLKLHPCLLVSEYKVLDSSDLPGQFDYRCRMSMSGAGCTLSVFDQREAEDLCEQDPECKALVMTDQLTWAGQCVDSAVWAFVFLVG